MNKFMVMIANNVGKIAVVVALLSVNTTCHWISHQPEVPKSLKNFKKR
ncbi:MAG: cyclic lactone autoinducer peptide [Sarcina sp.]